MLSELSRRLDGNVFERGQVGYESARLNAIWNGRKPDRYPQLIVQAASTEDVIAAVDFSRDHGIRVGIRSGGHSWSASFLRDAGMLLDVSRLDHCRIAPEDRRAVVGPGAFGSRLNAELAPFDLFFPVGHCESVALGGYLLQGGFGLGGRRLGPACASIVGIEVVTAAGELLHLDQGADPDLFWAARGAGAGFFAVVTSFELALIPRPAIILSSRQEHPLDALEELLLWSAGPEVSVPPNTELTLSVIGSPRAGMEPTVNVAGFTLADSEREAKADLEFLSSCPRHSRSLAAVENELWSFERQRAEEARAYPAGMRFAMDNTCTDASPELLVPKIRRAAESMPGAPSHLLWIPWGHTPRPEDMAFSFEGKLLITACAMWADPDEDARNGAWATEAMRSLEEHSHGIRLSDENLFERPFTFLEPAKLARLEGIRDVYDAGRLFHCVWEPEALG